MICSSTTSISCVRSFCINAARSDLCRHALTPLMLSLQNTIERCASKLDLVAGHPDLPAVGLALAVIQTQLPVAGVPFALRGLAHVEGDIGAVTHVLLGPMHAVGSLHAGKPRSDLRVVQLAKGVRGIRRRERGGREGKCQGAAYEKFAGPHCVSSSRAMRTACPHCPSGWLA